MKDVDVDCQCRHSAKTVSKVRITQTGSLHFLMQACRLVVYYFKY
jgi:hypothetical protein